MLSAAKVSADAISFPNNSIRIMSSLMSASTFSQLVRMWKAV